MVSAPELRNCDLHTSDREEPGGSNLLLLGIVVIGLAAVGVRAAFLNHPMRYDESYNYLNFVARGPAYIATNYLPNNHILHTHAAWLSVKLAGNSPMALRLPAFLAGVLLVPATAWLAWMCSRRAGVVVAAALGVSGSSALIEYSANARGYSLLTLCTVLATCLLYRAMERPEQLRRWGLWGALCAAGFYTVPIMVLPVAGMLMLVLIRILSTNDPADRKSCLSGMVVGAGTFAAMGAGVYAPILFSGGTKPLSESGEMAYRILGDQIGSPIAMLTLLFDLWMRHLSVFMVGFVVVAVAACLFATMRTKDLRRTGLVLVVAVPILLALVARAPMPARTWLFALPIVWVIAALGFDDLLQWIRRKPVGYLTASILPLAGGVGLAAAFVTVAHAPSLCAEPGGLVLVEPALKECQDFGIDRCALIAPYTPATDYYRFIGNIPASSPALATASRVYIVTNSTRSLDELWSPAREGFTSFDRPVPLWTRPDGALYVADRVERNVLR